MNVTPQDAPDFETAVGNSEEAQARRDEERAAAAAASAAEKAKKAEEKALAKAAREELKAKNKADKAAAKAERDAQRAAAKAAKGTSGGGGRSGRYKDADIINIAEAWKGKNPKREGSASHPRFSLYQDGMTVGEYKKLNPSFGQADINWDADHGFITVSIVPTEPTSDTVNSSEETATEDTPA